MAEENRNLVFVVDDDDSARDSLQYLLASIGYELRLYRSARDFLAEYDSATPGCILLDQRMPGMSGHEMLKELRSRGVTTPVVLLTAYPDVETAVDAMKLGATDFLRKPYREQQLLDAVNCAIQADRNQREDAAKKLSFLDRRRRLTPRERQVMAGVIAGKPNRVIAQDLDIAERTVEMHRFQVMRKMEVGTLAELVRQATRYGETDTGPSPESV